MKKKLLSLLLAIGLLLVPISVPEIQVNVPGTQVNVPGTQTSAPDTQTSAPDTQVSAPGIQANAPAIPEAAITQTASASTILATYNLTDGVTLRSHETVSLVCVKLKKGDRVRFAMTTTGRAAVGVHRMKTGTNYEEISDRYHDGVFMIPTDGYYRIYIENQCAKKITAGGVIWVLR